MFDGLDLRDQLRGHGSIGGEGPHPKIKIRDV